MINERYKSLSNVEWAFRSSKTTHLEMRPIHVRLASRTRGHTFVVMLAYLIIQELSFCWKGKEVTVEEGIKELCSLSTMDQNIAGVNIMGRIPEPRPLSEELLDLAKVILPETLPSSTFDVSTRKKLVKRRETS